MRSPAGQNTSSIVKEFRVTPPVLDVAVVLVVDVVVVVTELELLVVEEVELPADVRK